MSHCLIGLGSNLGDRQSILDSALAALRGSPQIRVEAISSFRETKPIGGPTDQSQFINAAALLDSSLPPQSILKLLEQIEIEHGRRREAHWGPRTLDLDMLLYDDAVLCTPNLVLPHPRMAWRRFVLEPAAEVAGTMIHPTIGWTIARLLEHLNIAAPYVAIAGPIASGKTHLARQLCEKLSARLISESLDEGHLETFYADPAGHAWPTELEFLQQRTSLLSADAHLWSQRRLAVSDFWFDQSNAFAKAWLSESQWPIYNEQWRQARQRIVQPKMLVLLDAPAEVLMDRIRRRARGGEQYLNTIQVERIRQLIQEQASQPELGPVLKIDCTDSNSALQEVSAAIQSMG